MEVAYNQIMLIDHIYAGAGAPVFYDIKKGYMTVKKIYIKCGKIVALCGHIFRGMI